MILLFSTGGRLLLSLLLAVGFFLALVAFFKCLNWIFTFLFGFLGLRSREDHEHHQSHQRTSRRNHARDNDYEEAQFRSESGFYSEDRFDQKDEHYTNDQRSNRRSRSSNEDQSQGEQRSSPATEAEKRIDGSTWYEILNVQRNATASQVKTAFLNHMKIVHPDRVASQPPEIQSLANTLTRRAKDAYDEYKRIKGIK